MQIIGGTNMAQSDLNDNDILGLDIPPEEIEGETPIEVPSILSPSDTEKYINMVENSRLYQEEYLLFVRNDSRAPLTPITIDFMYQIVSINKTYNDNTIIEMRDYAGVTVEQQINVKVYLSDDPDVVNEVIEKPYIVKQPLNKWIHLTFRYDIETHTWSAFYNEDMWFQIKDHPKFSPDSLNYIKVYIKIPYPEGGDYQAYIANLTITKNGKPISYYPPYPRDYGPIFIGGPITIIRPFWKDLRLNVIIDTNIILWWPVRDPLNIWECGYPPGYFPGGIFAPFPYGGRYIKYYYDFPPQIYGTYWKNIPAIGPLDPLHPGIMTFRFGGVLGSPYPTGPLTFESWLYIDYTTHPGNYISVYSFGGGSFGPIRLCFNGLNFGIFYNGSIIALPRRNYVNQWLHVAYSYISTTKQLLIFINGIQIHVIENIIFNPVDFRVFTNTLNAGMKFYHIGIRCSKIAKYTGPFEIINYIYPPYEVFPGGPGYPVSPPVLPSTIENGLVFKYPTTMNASSYDSNGTYYLSSDNISLTDKLGDNQTYKVPLITNNNYQTLSEIDFLDTKHYAVPKTYTLEFWIYISEDCTIEPDRESNPEYSNYDYITLILGVNAIYFGVHQKGSENMIIEETFTKRSSGISLENKWNHIAITCANSIDLALFVNGNKLYTQSNPKITFDIYQLYLSLEKTTNNKIANNITNITMTSSIKYTNNFDPLKLDNIPYYL